MGKASNESSVKPADKANQPTGKATKAPVIPAFIKAAELAAHLCIGMSQLGIWVREQNIPPPWARVGERTRLWRRKDFDEFVQKGRWPEEAWGHKKR